MLRPKCVKGGLEYWWCCCCGFCLHSTCIIHATRRGSKQETQINPLNAELNTICHLLALLGGATIVVVSRLRVNVVQGVLNLLHAAVH